MDERDATDLVSSLFDCLYTPLLRYAWRACGRVDWAEDVVQETFMKLYRTLREGQRVDSPRAWAYCVVRHDIGKRAKADCRFAEIHESAEVLESIPLPNWEAPFLVTEQDELTRLLGTLSPREEEALLLRMGALKYREIAAELRISTKSVSTMLSRALRKLQKAAHAGGVQEPNDPHVARRPPKALH